MSQRVTKLSRQAVPRSRAQQNLHSVVMRRADAGNFRDPGELGELRMEGPRRLQAGIRGRTGRRLIDVVGYDKLSSLAPDISQLQHHLRQELLLHVQTEILNVR